MEKVYYLNLFETVFASNTECFNNTENFIYILKIIFISTISELYRKKKNKKK